MNHEDNYQVKNPLRVEYIGADRCPGNPFIKIKN
jgi:hypothetical protein